MLFWWNQSEIEALLKQHQGSWRLLLLSTGSLGLSNNETEQNQELGPGSAHVTYFAVALAVEHVSPDCQGWLLSLDQHAWEEFASTPSAHAMDGERWRAVGPWQRQFNRATQGYLMHLLEHCAHRSEEPEVQWLGIQWALHEFWRCWWLAEERAPIGSTAALTKQIIAHIHTQTPPPRGPALAQEFGVSADHLARVFKRDMGMSIDAYRDKVRIEAALSLLHERKMDLHELAIEVGFGSYAPFYRAFRKIVGLSPSSWLKRSPL